VSIVDSTDWKYHFLYLDQNAIDRYWSYCV